MIHPYRVVFPVLLVSLTFMELGCQMMGASYESLLLLDQSGKTPEALAGYQKYLKEHPATLLSAPIYYRIAKDYESQKDYSNAILWYEKILAQYPHSDEELHAILDLAALYRDELKNPAKTMEYNQKAFDRYLDNIQIREAVQSLIDLQLGNAVTQYAAKDYKTVVDSIDGIQRNFPAVFIPPDTKAKLDSLRDRARRALVIAAASVDWIVLKSEIPFNKSYEGDFSAPLRDEQILPSPDGQYLAQRKKASNGKYYLYVAKVPAKGDEVRFDLVPQTIGAELPAWSPDGKELVYWRRQGSSRHLDKTDVQTKKTQVLFLTKGNGLGIHPAFHPAGNKIAYVYEGRITLANIGNSSFKQLLKTSKKLDYTAALDWSKDGTMIRCSQQDKHGQLTEELLILDVSTPTAQQ
ncbi:MAG TPA: hypothetical protein VHE12_13415 [bacterium]|nr:hypothetical protein [bacterium]